MPAAGGFALDQIERNEDIGRAKRASGFDQLKKYLRSFGAHGRGALIHGGKRYAQQIAIVHVPRADDGYILGHP